MQNLHSKILYLTRVLASCRCCCSGFLALECNQFANFRYFAAFANVQVFGSLAFFCCCYRFPSPPHILVCHLFCVAFFSLPTLERIERVSVYTVYMSRDLPSFVQAVSQSHGTMQMMHGWLLAPSSWRLHPNSCLDAMFVALAYVWVVFWPKVLSLANGVVIFVAIEFCTAHTFGRGQSQAISPLAHCLLANSCI